MREQLVDRAMRGDREAFTFLARDRADRCYAVAYRVLRDPHRAQDAVQQALFGAWRDLPTLRDPDRFDAWLLKLVVNACYTEARAPIAAGRRRCAPSPSTFPSSPTSPAPWRRATSSSTPSSG